MPAPLMMPSFVLVAFSVNVVDTPVNVTSPAPFRAAMLSDPVNTVVPALVIVAFVPNAPPFEVKVAPAAVPMAVAAVAPESL